MKNLLTLSLFLFLYIGISFSQEIKELDYNFVNTDLSQKDFNKVKLFFRYGNGLPVINVRISPNSKYLATLDNGGYIVIWDIDSRTQIMSINGVKDGISTILFTPDGKYLIGTGNKDKSKYLYYWDYKTGKVAFRKNLKFPIYNMHISPDKKKLYTIGPKSGIQVRDLRNGDLIKKMKLGLTTGSTFAISPDGRYLVFGNTSSAAKAGKAIGSAITGSDKEGFIQIRDFETGKNLKEFYVGKSSNYNFLQSVIFKDDKIIIIGNFDQANFFTFDLIKMKKKKKKAKVPLQIRTVEQSADGNYFYVSINKKLIKINTTKFKQVEEYPITDWVRSIDFDEGGEFFITGGGDPSTGDNSIRVWDYKTDKQLEKFEGKVAAIYSASLAKKNNDIVLGTYEGKAQLLSLKTGDIKTTLDAGEGMVTSKTTKNGKYLVTSAIGPLIMKGLFKWEQHKIIKIWNSETYQLIDSFPDFSQFIISNDDKAVFVMGNGTRMKTIDFKTGDILADDKKMAAFSPIAFNKESTKILTQAAGTFKIRDAKTFKKLVVGKKLKKRKGSLTSLFYNKDETKIIGTISNLGIFNPKKVKGTLVEWDLDGEISRVIYKNDSVMISNAILSPSKDKILCGLKYKDGTGGIIKIDLKTGAILDSLDDVGFPLDYTDDEKYLLSYTDINKMGLSLLDAKTYKPNISYLKVKGNDGYALFTGDHYYKITKNSRDAISFIKSGNIYPFEQFDLQYNRPDIIISRMPYPDQQLIEIYNKAYKKRLQKMGLTEEDLKMDFNLPIVKITDKDKLPISYNLKTFTININAKGNGSKLQNLKIWVNDVPLYGSKGFDLSSLNTETIKKDIDIELSEGRNKIQVAVLNNKGVESLKDTKYIEYTGAKTKHDLYIVAIGVSKYTDSQYNLTYATKDVNDFVKYMQKQESSFSQIHVYKFIDADARVENILKIKKELQKTHVDDEVVVYFAGHGLLNKDLDYFLGMYNVDFNKPEENGMSIDDFESLVDGIPSRKKSMFIDACHSGEVDKEEILNIKENIKQGDVVFRAGNIPESSNITRKNSNLKNSFELMKETFTDLRRGSGAMIISAAGGGEFAKESDKWKNGVFTFSVLQGLESGDADYNGDNDISVTELATYVSNNVRQLTAGQQNPTFRRENLEFDYSFINPEKTIINENDNIVYDADAIFASNQAANDENTTQRSENNEEFGVKQNNRQSTTKSNRREKWDLKDIESINNNSYLVLKDLSIDELRYYKYKTVRKSIKASGLEAYDISYSLGELRRRRRKSNILFIIPYVDLVAAPIIFIMRMGKHKKAKKKVINYRENNDKS